MPIEIRELQINVTVDSPQPQAGGAADAGGAQGDALTKEDKKKIIDQCIEQTIAIINNKKER